MKLTIDIPEKLLARIVQSSAAATSEDAVLEALEEFVRRDNDSDAIADLDEWDLGPTEEPDELQAPETIQPRPG